MEPLRGTLSLLAPTLSPRSTGGRGSWLAIATCLAITGLADAQPPVRPKPPAVQDRAWIQIPLDAFILHRLEAEKLKPAPEASREEILERLTRAIAGRSATKAEIAAFVASTNKRAYEKELDRLLCEKDFDERFADVRRLVRKDGFRETDAHDDDG